MGVSLELFSGLVGGVYDAALDASLWSKALKDIVATFNGGCGALLASRRQSCRALHASVGWDRASVASYNAYYGRIDPFASAIERMPVGHVFRCREVVAPDEQRGSEFFNDWAGQNGVGEGVFASLVRDGDSTVWLGVGGGFQSGSDTDKIDRLRLLVPHLQQALRVQSRLGDAAYRQRGALEAFNRLAHGVVLFDAGGTVLFANRAAERIAAADDGLALARTGLHAAHPDENAALQRLIGQAVGKQGDGLRAGGALALTRPSARQRFVIQVLPTNAGEEQLPVSAALAVIVDPEREPQALAAVLRRIYRLTPAEAIVACEVSRGEGLRSVADKTAVSLSTVRVHLQRVFEKTRTHRQAELARLLLTIDAAIEPSRTLP